MARLPWLLVGLIGAMGAAVLIGAFEERLEANVLIAFFVPAVVYMADAVGTQTETVLIRALAADVSTRSIFAREVVTGLVMGIVVGAVSFAFAVVGWGDQQVALAVAIALLASCSIATLVAMALPAAFQRSAATPPSGPGRWRPSYRISCRSPSTWRLWYPGRLAGVKLGGAPTRT